MAPKRPGGLDRKLGLGTTHADVACPTVAEVERMSGAAALAERRDRDEGPAHALAVADITKDVQRGADRGTRGVLGVADAVRVEEELGLLGVIRHVVASEREHGLVSELGLVAALANVMRNRVGESEFSGRLAAALDGGDVPERHAAVGAAAVAVTNGLVHRCRCRGLLLRGRPPDEGVACKDSKGSNRKAFGLALAWHRASALSTMESMR